jgi:hypothetical protein
MSVRRNFSDLRQGLFLLPFIKKSKKYHVNPVNPWPRPGNARWLIINKF